jgi:hypothetical protein
MSTPDPIDYYPTIKDLPCSDRPRERLVRILVSKIMGSLQSVGMPALRIA